MIGRRNKAKKHNNDLLGDNYIRINQISARCMRLCAVLVLMDYIFTRIFAGLDPFLCTVVFSCAIFIAFIPTLLINILKLDNVQCMKYIVIICISLICTMMLSILGYYAYPIILFPIMIASLYYNQTLVLFSSFMLSIGIFVSNYINFCNRSVLIGCNQEDYNDVLLRLTVPHIFIVFSMSIVAYFLVQRNAMILHTASNIATTMKNNQNGLIYSFAELSESKSKATGEHIKRVAEYMRILGKASGFDDEYVEMLCTASMMHDIGKLMINEEILEKPGKLTSEEYQTIKNHVLYGEALLERCPGEIMHLACILAKEHHERWDGSGYLGMKGEEIAYISRLMAVCDVFDALTSNRSYKQGWTLEDTYNEIIRLSGSSFDPKVVRLFIKNFDAFKEVRNSIPDIQVY